MNIQRLSALIGKDRQFSPLSSLVLYRWLCRRTIQQAHYAKLEHRRTTRHLKKGRISIFQQSRARRHLDLCQQMMESCADEMVRSGQFLTGILRQMIASDYASAHLSALFNIPIARLLNNIAEATTEGCTLTIYDLVLHHVECQDPGCDFVPNDESMPFFNVILKYFFAEMERNRELRDTLDQGFNKFFPEVRRMHLQPAGPDGRQAAYQEQTPLVVHRQDGTTRTVQRPPRFIGYTQP